jgi:Kdo2-lipid IVA lauroyltransferase/acyltransferase
VSASGSPAAGRDSGGAPAGTWRLLRTYWQPRHWPAWSFILWLKLSALLPWRLTVALHYELGRALWYLLPRSRRVMLRNLEVCMPQLSAAEAEALARRHFRNLGASMGEVALAWFGTAPWTRPPVRVEGLEHLNAALAKGRGVILYTGHFTPVEIATQFLKPLIPLFAFMFTQRNSPVLDAMQARGRLRTGHVPLPSTAIRGLVRELKRNAVVWYAPDLAYVSNSAQLVPFFGEPAMTNTGASRLATLTGATIVPLYFRRLDGGEGYLVRFSAPPAGVPSDDVLEDTRKLALVLEGFIRECPEQYFWTQRKFKNRGPSLPDVYARS